MTRAKKTIPFWICLIVSIGLIVAGFCVPPMGIIDGSVLTAVGIQTLDNILRKLDELGLWVSNYTFQAFNQRFLDECAGVFTNVTIDIPISSVCPESFADFGQDFNEDFMIY